MKKPNPDISAAVKKVVSLAQMNFDEKRQADVAEKALTVIAYVEQLNEVSVEGVEPTSHAVNFTTPLREDVAVSSNMAEEIISLYPERYESLVKVPKVIDGE